MALAVEFQDVSRHFGEVRAVDGVDLAIPEGAFFAMLGPSGSGKTTCLRLISGFDQPTAGHVAHLRRGGRGRAAQPPQRQHRLPGLRALPAPQRPRQRRLRADGQGRGAGRAPRRRRGDAGAGQARGLRRPQARPALRRPAPARRARPARWSTSPRVLLLDEPLGALDLKLREAMQDELKALQTRLGITFVFVTHDQGEALSMADQVAVFNEGRIAQVGTPVGDLRAPAHPLRRRLRRLLQRAAARDRRPLRRRAPPGRASAPRR